MVYADHVDWDEPDDPRGNVQHIAHNGITVEEWSQRRTEFEAAWL